MKTNLAPTMVTEVLKKLGRTAVMNGKDLTFTDGQKAPTDEEWDLARRAVKRRKTTTGEGFMGLFTVSEKHDMLRRAVQSVNVSAAAPLVADVLLRMMMLQRIRSDDAQAAEMLDVLQNAGVITGPRRNRIAAFELPAV